MHRAHTVQQDSATFSLLASQTCGVVQEHAKSVERAISIQQRLPQLTASSQLQKQLSLASFNLIVYTGPDRLNIPGEPEHETLKVRSHFPQLNACKCICLPKLFPLVSNCIY